MTTTLTERYIAATVKSLTPTAQDDVRAELEASIDDAIEARVEQGEARAEAERAVLRGLGDPAILAAGYADRPLHLIGPRYYLTWWRLLKLLLWIVPIFAVTGVVFAQVLADASIGEIIGQAVTVGISVIVHLAFWVTLVFFILERTGADTGVRWDVDQLPEPQTDGVGRSDVIASLVFLGLAAGAVLWDALRGFVRPDGEALPILDPELWPWWMIALFVLMAAEAALAIGIHRVRRWTVGFAVMNTVLALAFAIPAMYLLLSGQIVNPEFIEFLATDHAAGLAEANAGTRDQGGIGRVLTVIFGTLIVGIALWDILDGWLKTARARRA